MAAINQRQYFMLKLLDDKKDSATLEEFQAAFPDFRDCVSGFLENLITQKLVVRSPGVIPGSDDGIVLDAVALIGPDCYITYLGENAITAFEALPPEKQKERFPECW